MANRIQHLRGSETEHSTYTGAKGEISLVTDTSANRIPTGELRIHDGSTAGGLPVKFGDTTLNDYEEGTWDAFYGRYTTEPTITDSSSYGIFTRVGRLVHATCRLQAVTITNAGAGYVYVGGLPFASASTGYDLFTPSVFAFGTWSITNAPRTGFVLPSSTRIRIKSYDSADARNMADTDVTNLTNNCGIILNVIYMV